MVNKISTWCIYWMIALIKSGVFADGRWRWHGEDGRIRRFTRRRLGRNGCTAAGSLPLRRRSAFVLRQILL